MAVKLAKIARNPPCIKKGDKFKKKKKPIARMDLRNRALCYAYRNPAPGQEKVKFRDIIELKLVVKTDGTVPQAGAIADAAKSFHEEKQKRGRKKGWQKTTKAENKKILDKFKELRPPGCGIDSREVHKNLPTNLRAKITRRLVVRRLADKGYTAQKKLTKNDPSKTLCKRRLKFSEKYRGWTKAQWNAEVQGVGDIKQFTYYPKKLYSKFKRLRASWTYMSQKERYQTAFLRPKKWFPKKEWKLTKPQKVFGMTTSTGKCLAFLIPSPFDGAVWGRLVRTKVGPFLRRSFPNRASFKILLDSEKILHAAEAKAAYRDWNIEILAGWPKYSPELNPQENVWPKAEKALREKEGDGGESFEQFQQWALQSVREYVGAKNLVGGMVNRIEECIATKGSFISK